MDETAQAAARGEYRCLAPHQAGHRQGPRCLQHGVSSDLKPVIQDLRELQSIDSGNDKARNSASNSGLVSEVREG